MRSRSILLSLMLCLGILVMLSSPVFGLSWSMPESISEQGNEVDKLFWLIFWITTITFVITEGLLVYTVLAFRHKEGRKAKYTHGNPKLEIAWTLVPGAILFFLAVFQTGTWKRMKMSLPADDPDTVHVRLFAKRFEWWFWYAGKDGEFETADDVWSGQSYLNVPKDRNVIVEMRSKDVIHSFFLPHLRFKQDVMPGMSIKQWFKANKTTIQARTERKDDKFYYEIACAELCGADHFDMKGILDIMDSDKFDTWLKEKAADPNKNYRNPLWDEWDKIYGPPHYPPVSGHKGAGHEEGVSVEK